MRRKEDFKISTFFDILSEIPRLLAMILLLALVVYSKERSRWKKSLIWLWAINLIVMGTLMHGGVLGMPVVETSQWSGLPLTFILSFFGMIAAYPLGIFLALGRQSKMPASPTLATASSATWP
ncbi:MAG: hypothetical protein P8Y70_08645, partial [Candidatus Lokiarchaeota archaeon]